MWFRVSNRQQISTHPTIILDNVPLTVVSKQRYLGLIFDECLAWSHHVSKVCKSMSYYLYLLLKHRHVIKEDLWKTLTESLVLSHSLYCLPVWGPSLSHYYSLQRLQRMHNRAVRLCKSLHKYDHVSHHYQSLNWLPFELLVQHRSLCAMNKLFKFQCIPLDPPIVFGRIHSHQTRTRVFFAQPVRCRFSFTQRYFRST